MLLVVPVGTANRLTPSPTGPWVLLPTCAPLLCFACFFFPNVLYQSYLFKYAQKRRLLGTMVMMRDAWCVCHKSVLAHAPHCSCISFLLHEHFAAQAPCCTSTRHKRLRTHNCNSATKRPQCRISGNWTMHGVATKLHSLTL